MISNSFTLFSSDVHFIFNHIEVSKLQSKLSKELSKATPDNKTEIEKQFLEKYFTFSTQEKQMTYSSNVIFLYGIFEQFVESSIREYIEAVCSLLTCFDDHDETIRKKYFELWMGMQSKLEWEKYTGLTRESMVKNLYETQFERKNNIMYQCFLKNGGNYNHEKVSDAINSITGQNFKDLISNYNPLRRNLEKSGIAKSNIDIKYARLNDFVKSRNDIAHNGRPAEMLGDEDFRQTIHFILKYGESLTLFLNDNYLRKFWEIQTIYKTALLLESLNGWIKNKTYAFKSTNVLIYKDQEVIVQQPNGQYPKYIKSSVVEIRQKMVDGSIIDVSEINSVDQVEFSIKINDKVSKKSQFLFLW